MRVARYRFPLRRPMRFAGRTLSRRCGFFLRIEIDGRSGVGEVAPMPGVHRESVEECIALTGSLSEEFLRAAAADESALDRLPSCVAFGLSCALGRIAGGLFDHPLRPRTGVNALFTGDEEEAKKALATGRFEGWRTIKVKVGRPDGAMERRMIELLVKSLPASVRLRLDANRTLALPEAIRRFDGLDPERIEYVEEPLMDPIELPAFAEATGLGVALDESLLDPFLRSALEYVPGIVAHVLKPSLHGRIGRVRERAERTARQGLRTTLSNALESGYTIRLLARLATWLPGPERDHGLASGDLLKDDPLPAAIERGFMSNEGAPPEPPLSFDEVGDG